MHQFSEARDAEYSFRTKIFLWIFYFSIYLLLAFAVRDLPDQINTLTISASQLIHSGEYATHDPAYFATAALDIAQNGWVTQENSWILNLWPPGFILLQALLLKFFSTEAPIFLILQVLMAGLCAWLSIQLADFLLQTFNRQTAFLIPLLIFSFPVSRMFLLQPSGIVFGEGFAIVFFLLGMLNLVKATELPPAKNSFFAGIFLALAAYFRTQFDLILLVLSAIGTISIFYFFAKSIKNGIIPQASKNFAKNLLIALVTIHMVMLPWRLYHQYKHHTIKWVQTDSVAYGNSIRSEAELRRVDGDFVVAGRGNLACIIDPSTCDAKGDARKYFFETFRNNVIKWYSLKYQIFPKYWFASIENWTKIPVKRTLVDVILNSVILATILASWCILALHRARIQAACQMILVFNLAVYSAYWLIFTIQQFETRYFYFPKIFGIVNFILLVALCRNPAKSEEIRESSR